MRAIEIRARARKSRAWVAAMAGCSEPTAKLYELCGPDAVGQRAREALAAVYAKLDAMAPATSPGGTAA